MKKQILSISLLQTAKVLAALAFLVPLPFLLLMGVQMMAMPDRRPPFFGGFMLLLPFAYALFGFLVTLFAAWVYNVLAKRIGGVEFTVGDAPKA
jgi:hypothetical protein